MPNIPDPVVKPHGDYGTIILKPKFRLLDQETRNLFGTKEYFFLDSAPPTFESLNVSNWLVFYESDLSTIDFSKINNITLKATPKDRALVYLDDEFVGTFSRMHNVTSLITNLISAKYLQILVENQGHINMGNIDVEDFKVID